MNSLSSNSKLSEIKKLLKEILAGSTIHGIPHLYKDTIFSSIYKSNSFG